MLEPNRILRISRWGLLAATALCALALLYRFRFVNVTPGCDALAPEIAMPRRVLVDRLPVLNLPIFDDALARGDVVVYNARVRDRTVTHLGVVGAVPGDEIERLDDGLRVSGIDAPLPPAPEEVKGRVPPRSYLLFNRNPHSTVPDSRVFGWIDERAILGRLAAVVPF